MARQVHAYIESTFNPGEVVDLVGFSMGGLIARYYVQRLAVMGRVSRLVTISSPARYGLPGCVVTPASGKCVLAAAFCGI